jgi:hypothetical protein
MLGFIGISLKHDGRGTTGEKVPRSHRNPLLAEVKIRMQMEKVGHH